MNEHQAIATSTDSGSRDPASRPTEAAPSGAVRIDTPRAQDRSTNPTPAATPRGDQPAGEVAKSPEPPPGMTRHGKVRRTRMSAWWVGLIITAILLIALLIFIAQNSRTVAVQYVGANGHVSLAVALLVAAVAGVLLIAIPGAARIIQLRRALKRNAAIHHSADHTTDERQGS
jgi:uncharacterized integral membrane protein